MQPETKPAPDWYDDPETPGSLRFWDGDAWTDDRAPKGKRPKPAKAPKVAKPAPATPAESEPGPSFALVVAGVLGAATLLIIGLTLAVIWVDSYNTGKERGERLGQQGNLTPAQAEQSCRDLAEDVRAVGSANGSWDRPWIIGCTRAAN